MTSPFQAKITRVYNALMNKINSSISTHNNSNSAHSSLFNGKANSVHTHSTSDITDFPAIPSDLEDLTDNTGILHFDDYIAYDDMGGVPLSDFNNDLIKLEGVSGYTIIQEDTENGTQIAFNEKLIYDYTDTDKVYYDANGNWIDPDNEIATKGDIPVVTGKENSANKVSSWSATTNNTRYPSEKLVKDSLDAKLELNDLLELIYPIGSIYMEKDTTSHSVCPIQLTLGGTWTRIQNRFLYASENGQGVSQTGGEASHTLTESEMPRHTHTQNAHNHKPSNTSYGFFTGDENIAMTSKRALVSGSGNYSYLYGTTQGTVTEPNTTADTTATNKYTGGDTTTGETAGNGVAHNNMPPYIIVNVWERTA